MTPERPPLAHNRARYSRGCRCGICREANRRYQQRYRAKPFTAVPPPPGTGRVAAAVAAQLDATGTTEARPGLAAAAVRLAELLDNPEAVPQHPAAAGRLIELLAKLELGDTRRGRLTVVRGMTGRR